MLDEDEGGKINGTNINESTVALIIIKKYIIVIVEIHILNQNHKLNVTLLI